MSKEEIIKAIKENYLNDVEFFIDIIKEGTDYWDPMVETLQELGNHLLENDEIDQFVRFYDEREYDEN
jgi:hypothetical protein